MVPAPYLFNFWKHHAGAVRERIRQSIPAEKPAERADDELGAGPGDLADGLALIGANVMDVYFGAYSVVEIVERVDRVLEEAGAREPEAYLRWLGGTSAYRSLEIADGSRWVCLYGRQPGRHIHLHPARSSPHTARFSANVWKTAVALYGEDPDHAPLHDLARVNRARVRLGLSPVKRVGHGALGAAIGVMFELGR